MRNARHDERYTADLGADFGMEFDCCDITVERRRPKHAKAGGVIRDRVGGNRSEYFRVGRITRKAHRQVRIGGGDLQRDAQRSGIGRDDLQFGGACPVRKRLPGKRRDGNPLRCGRDAASVPDRERTTLCAFGELFLRGRRLGVARLDEASLGIGWRRQCDTHRGRCRRQNQCSSDFLFSQRRPIFSRRY